MHIIIVYYKGLLIFMLLISTRELSTLTLEALDQLE